MTKKRIVICVLLSSLLLVPALSQGTVVLDQSFPTISSSSGFGYNPFVTPHTNLIKAQTFTVGLAGKLATVEAFMVQWTSDGGNYSLDILNTSGGVPTYSSLGTITRPLASLPPSPDWDWVSFDVSFLNIQVTPGEVLAMAFSAPNPGAADLGYGLGGYLGGSQFYSIDKGNFQPLDGDLNFKTYVDTGTPSAVPEPTTLLLLGLGLIGLTGIRRKMQR